MRHDDPSSRQYTKLEWTILFIESAFEVFEYNVNFPCSGRLVQREASPLQLRAVLLPVQAGGLIRAHDTERRGSIYTTTVIIVVKSCFVAKGSISGYLMVLCDTIT